MIIVTVVLVAVFAFNNHAEGFKDIRVTNTHPSHAPILCRGGPTPFTAAFCNGRTPGRYRHPLEPKWMIHCPQGICEECSAKLNLEFNEFCQQCVAPVHRDNPTICRPTPPPKVNPCDDPLINRGCTDKGSCLSTAGDVANPFEVLTYCQCVHGQYICRNCQPGMRWGTTCCVQNVDNRSGPIP